MSTLRMKVSKYVGNLDIVGKVIPNDDFTDIMETLIIINPKVEHLWMIIGEGVKLSKIFGGSWADLVNWEVLLANFEIEITEVIDMFQSEMPEYFLHNAGLWNLFRNHSESCENCEGCD